MGCAVNAPHPHRRGHALLPVESWAETLRLAETPTPLYYHAPLDLMPRLVRIVRVFKNEKIRVDPQVIGTDYFTADKGHRDRFLRLAVGECEAKRAARRLGHIALCQGRVFECVRCEARGEWSGQTDCSYGSIFAEKCPNANEGGR